MNIAVLFHETIEARRKTTIVSAEFQGVDPYDTKQIAGVVATLKECAVNAHFELGETEVDIFADGVKLNPSEVATP